MIPISFFYYYEGIYPYEYMDDWKKFNEKSLPEKEDFLQPIKYGRCY